jgi:hypothetical protein
MGTFDVDVSELTVPSGHLKTGMAQHPLQAKDIATISQESDGSGMA